MYIEETKIMQLTVFSVVESIKNFKLQLDGKIYSLLSLAIVYYAFCPILIKYSDTMDYFDFWQDSLNRGCPITHTQNLIKWFA
jgi:hypothetical protein